MWTLENLKLHRGSCYISTWTSLFQNIQEEPLGTQNLEPPCAGGETEAQGEGTCPRSQGQEAEWPSIGTQVAGTQLGRHTLGPPVSPGPRVPQDDVEAHA